MNLRNSFIFVAAFSAIVATGCARKDNTVTQPSIEPYPPVSGAFSGKTCAASPDPLVAYRWKNPKATDSLEIYTLSPVTVKADDAKQVEIKDASSIHVTGECDLMFDFGCVSAAWLEFDSPNLDGDVEASISEYNEPAVFNSGSEHPVKTAQPVRYGDTYRLELNKQLYEGVRFAWIHIRKLNRPADISNVRLVCQIKPVNYEGSFGCSSDMLTRAWYTGAYEVKLNLLYDYFGAILMERSDRHSWTGDAHPSQAASLVAFGNFDFVKTNIRHTSKGANSIASYALYWVLSLIDYYNYTGDQPLLDEMLENACAKLDAAYQHFGQQPLLNFYGWDERLGAGFENPNCAESQNAYKMLSIRTWKEFAKTLAQAGYAELSDKYKRYADEKIAALRQDPDWALPFGVHAAADAVNAAFINPQEQATLWERAFSDRQQRVSYSPFNQYFIIQSLARMKRYDEALATIDDCWGGQLRYGATTFFEVFRPSWNQISQPNDAPVNNQCGYTSLTHPWSAGVTKWLSEEVLGVKPTSPGFASFAVQPHLSAAVTWVKGTVPTPTGIISFSLNAESGKGELVVPAGTQATLGIPKAGRSISGVQINGKSSVQTREDDEYVYYAGLAAGRYRIKVDYSGKLRAPATEPFRYAIETIVGEDATTGGNWKGRYGSKGYALLNFDSLTHRIVLPDFVENIIFKKTGNLHWATATNDRRALPSDRNDTRNIGAIITRDPVACDQTMTIDIPCRQTQSYKLSLYFADWDRKNRRTAIEIFDLDSKNLLMPLYMVHDYAEGKYVSFLLDRPVRVRINQVRGVNAALSGVFLD